MVFCVFDGVDEGFVVFWDVLRRFVFRGLVFNSLILCCYYGVRQKLGMGGGRRVCGFLR